MPVGFPACMPVLHPVLKSREKRHPFVATPEVRESARPATRAHSLFALQHTHRRGLCPLGAGVHPFPRFAPPGNAGRRRGRGVPLLAGQCPQRRGIDAQAGAVGLAVLLPQGARHRLAADDGDWRAAHEAPTAGGLVARRGGPHPVPARRRAPPVCPAAVWHRDADQRGAAASCHGHRFQPRHDHRARGQGWQGTGADAAAAAGAPDIAVSGALSGAACSLPS